MVNDDKPESKCRRTTKRPLSSLSVRSVRWYVSKIPKTLVRATKPKEDGWDVMVK